ncbi:MAG: RNA polymerase sigma factor [bacterium]|nr:RNA polymerase sigma factor [bacterium]
MAPETLGPDEFTTAIARHGRSLWVLGAAWVGRDDAADLVQETARVAWQRRTDFTPGSDVRAWLSQIARHVGANWRRRRGPVLVADVDSECESPVAPVAQSPDVRFDADGLGLSDELANGLAALSASARACLLLHVVMDHSFGEIASMLDIPENTAASHARRARIALRAALSSSAPVGEVR